MKGEKQAHLEYQIKRPQKWLAQESNQHLSFNRQMNKGTTFIEEKKKVNHLK